MQLRTRTIEGFFNKEYLEYAQYTCENRAIPSVVDGMKPGARKIVYSALKGMKRGNKYKFVDLVGSTYKYAHYNHGDASLSSTIITLSSKYLDNLPPFEIIGSGGDLKNRNSAAPRYLAVSLSKYIDILDKHKEILEHHQDGDDTLEPKHYLPLLPLSLVKRTSGMALGYAYQNAISYNPVDIIDSILAILNEDKEYDKLLSPFVDSYKGVFVLRGDRMWTEGLFKFKKGKIIVNELPLSQTFSSFEDNLNKLEETDKILNWDNNSKDDHIEYIIHVNNTQLIKDYKSGKYYSKYKLGEFLKRPTLTLLNEKGKITQFRGVESVIKYFTNYRLSRYVDFKKYKVREITNTIKECEYVKLFIDLYISKKIKLNGIGMADVKKQLKEHKLPSSVLTIPISKLTKDEYNKLCKEINKLNNNKSTLTNTDVTEMYIKDLKILRKDIEKDFPRTDLKIEQITK